MTEHYFWEALAILIPIILGGFITIRIHAYHQKHDKDTRISDMKKAIKQEIQENMDEIKDYKITTKTVEAKTKSYISDDKITTKTEPKIKTTEIKYLIIASYESSINSGDFILLSGELRQEISELYTHIHITNFKTDQLIKSQYIMARNITKFEEIIQMQLDALTKSYQVIITKSENILKKL